MDHTEHEASAIKTWFLILLMVGWVAFKGWLALLIKWGFSALTFLNRKDLVDLVKA